LGNGYNNCLSCNLIGSKFSDQNQPKVEIATWRRWGGTKWIFLRSAGFKTKPKPTCRQGCNLGGSSVLNCILRIIIIFDLYRGRLPSPIVLFRKALKIII
jgi:hypothetical protein